MCNQKQLATVVGIQFTISITREHTTLVLWRTTHLQRIAV